MKKVKIMLTAIAVVAVVGGALAFKAKVTHNVWCGTVEGALAGGQLCAFQPETTIDRLDETSNIFCTDVVNTTCVRAISLPDL